MLTLATTAPGEPESLASLQGEGPSRWGGPVRSARAEPLQPRLPMVRHGLHLALHRRQSTLSAPPPRRPSFRSRRQPGDLVRGRCRRADRRARAVAPRGHRRRAAAARRGAGADARAATGRDGGDRDQRHPLPRARRSRRWSIKSTSARNWRTAATRPALRCCPSGLPNGAADARAWFKFVVAEPADLAEVLALIEAHAIPRAREFLMPEGRGSETLRARSAWLAPLCAQHGLNFTDRLHIHLFGDTRGT